MRAALRISAAALCAFAVSFVLVGVADGGGSGGEPGKARVAVSLTPVAGLPRLAEDPAVVRARRRARERRHEQLVARRRAARRRAARLAAAKARAPEPAAAVPAEPVTPEAPVTPPAAPVAPAPAPAPAPPPPPPPPPTFDDSG
jgi:hypothetical protein